MPTIGTFTGFGVQPRVLSATALSGTKVRVLFNESMNAASLNNVANFTITPDGGSVAETVELVEIGDDYVDLSVSAQFTQGTANYNVAVAHTVTDAAGNLLDPAYDDADFDGPLVNAAVVDYCARANDRLIEQLKDASVCNKIACIFSTRTQEVQQALVNVLAYRDMTNAIGATLDKIGERIQLRRGGLADEAYRQRLRARAKVVGSQGFVNDLLDILLFLDAGFAPAQVSATRQRPATIIMHCRVPAGEELTGEVFAMFLRDAKPAGVRLELEFEENGVVLFAWALNVPEGDADPGAGSQWGEDATPNTGGTWAEAV
jgi:hypothetical protein